jgi:hypothetical protein
MPVKVRPVLAFVLLSSFAISVARADPGDPAPSGVSDGEACAQAYEQAQEQRQSGKLLEARARLQMCVRDACPEFIRSDCLTWNDELRADIPTVVFAARSAGRDLSDVRVSLGQRLLTAHIDGEALELDPGIYDFEFRPIGMQAMTQHVLISRGVKNRLLLAEFAPPGNGPARDSGTALPRQVERSWVLPAIFGGVGALGLAAFAGIAASGHSAESELEKTCSPHCNEDQVASVRTKYIIADVSLLVGVGSIGLASYFILRKNAAPRAESRPALDVRVSARNLSLTYQGAF